MAGGARRSTVNGGSVTQRTACSSPSRPIPMRGQIKGRIVMRLAHSVASIFSSTTPSHIR
ncbi:hypothetical protein RND81_06G116700 [Saponaria officinalis]|uniref:Uncharacterized protein n=1 Tax=Saponaria officinalis TaxID=3572 RepID=A0AAW1K9G5_SAPOF